MYKMIKTIKHKKQIDLQVLLTLNSYHLKIAESEKKNYVQIIYVSRFRLFDSYYFDFIFCNHCNSRFFQITFNQLKSSYLLKIAESEKKNEIRKKIYEFCRIKKTFDK
jgi:hypothetical protein